MVDISTLATCNYVMLSSEHYTVLGMQGSDFNVDNMHWGMDFNDEMGFSSPRFLRLRFYLGTAISSVQYCGIVLDCEFEPWIQLKRTQ
jgi:hypothetical protein